MGDPKRQRKKYKTPKHPWEAQRIAEEAQLMKEFGVTKKEIWRANALLDKWREQAKKIVGMPSEQAKEAEKELITKLYKLGVLPKDAHLDDVLALTNRDVLERRLQTQCYKQGLAASVKQARQFILHKKILVNSKMITAPSYFVKREDKISYVPGFNPKLRPTVVMSKEEAKNEG